MPAFFNSFIGNVAIEVLVERLKGVPFYNLQWCKNDLLTNNSTSYNNIQSQVYQQRNVTIIITVRSLRRSRYNIIILRPPRFRRCASTSID